VNIIFIKPETIEVVTRIWDRTARTFVKGPHEIFKR
jgi:hypothetical protein